MLDAEFVRKFPGKSLPFFQELRDNFTTEEPLVKVALDYADVVKGTHLETTLAVSHRWMQPDDPDPDGEQLKALKGFLNSPGGQKIERVWIDSACMPQDLPKGSRSAEDAAAFKGMLKEVNRLYLGTTVLILLDLSYVSRFWTQFESWLAMQFAMPDGLKPAVGTKNERHHIVCIQNAAPQAELFKKALIDMWATKTPQQAHAFLSKPDVTVTNQSDKEGQLPKIKALDSTVQAAFGDIPRLLKDELAASEAAAKRAEVELAAWEAENDAKAGEGNRLKVAARQAASAVAAARMAKPKEEYAQAISAELVPAMMKRGVALAEEEKEDTSLSDVPTLVALARDGTDGQKEEVAAALGRLAVNDENVVAIVKAGGIPSLVAQAPPLVTLARGGTAGEKEEAVRALAWLAFDNADNKVAIAKAGGIAPLVALARDGTGDQQEEAARALGNLAVNADNKVAIAKAGGIAPLVALVRDGTDGQKQYATVALCNLACNADNKVAIAKAGGIAPLVALALDGTDGQKEKAADALGWLAVNADNRVAIARAGGIAPLVALARDGTDGQKEKAADALRWLAKKNDDNKVAIAKAGGIAPLVALASGGTDGQKEYAAEALWYLGYNADNKVAIARAGGIAPLVALARRGTDGQKKHADMALYLLSDKKTNLAAMKDLGYGKKSFFGGWTLP